jgi:hypothetical protein
MPINTLFFFGIFFIISINIHFSLVISKLTEQNKKIAQKLALLELELKNNIFVHGEAAGGQMQKNRLRS